MADPYIDAFETLAYGRFACEQMEAVVLGLRDKCDEAIRFAISELAASNAAMRGVLERQEDRVAAAPSASAPEDPSAEIADSMVRFGKYLESVKGEPLPLKLFFRNDPPSVAARRRLSKLVPLLEHMVTTLKKHADKLRDARAWIEELTQVHAKAESYERFKREGKVQRLDSTPEVTQAREAWLEVYCAAKELVSGVLRFAGKTNLMPLCFDDLAEVHRASGVSDAPPEPAQPAP